MTVGPMEKLMLMAFEKGHQTVWMMGGQRELMMAGMMDGNASMVAQQGQPHQHQQQSVKIEGQADNGESK